MGPNEQTKKKGKEKETGDFWSVLALVNLCWSFTLKPCDTEAKPLHTAQHTRIMGLIRLQVILLYQPYLCKSLQTEKSKDYNMQYLAYFSLRRQNS